MLLDEIALPWDWWRIDQSVHLIKFYIRRDPHAPPQSAHSLHSCMHDMMMTWLGRLAGSWPSHLWCDNTTTICAKKACVKSLVKLQCLLFVTQQTTVLRTTPLELGSSTAPSFTISFMPRTKPGPACTQVGFLAPKSIHVPPAVQVCY